MEYISKSTTYRFMESDKFFFDIEEYQDGYIGIWVFDGDLGIKTFVMEFAKEVVEQLSDEEIVEAVVEFLATNQIYEQYQEMMSEFYDDEDSCDGDCDNCEYRSDDDDDGGFSYEPSPNVLSFPTRGSITPSALVKKLRDDAHNYRDVYRPL